MIHHLHVPNHLILLFVYKKKDDFIKDSFTWDLRKKHGFNLIEIEKNELKNLLPGLSEEYQFAIKINGQGYISNSQTLNMICGVGNVQKKLLIIVKSVYIINAFFI